MGRLFRCWLGFALASSRRAAARGRLARPLVRVAFVAVVIHAGAACALDIAGPPGSGRFGTDVRVLPNGNIVVTDYDGPVSGIGAVYLYSPTGALISTLTGSQANDHVGSGGIVVLANGNYVIRSPYWHNGLAASAGAVTWGNASSGVSGVVSATNSLVGSTADDQVGYYDVVALTNGNYVVNDPKWDDGGLVDVGAATWGNGNGGTVGAISAGNSLVGSQANDAIGNAEIYGGVGVVALSSGNYVVVSPYWSNGGMLYAGAVTWGNGNVGITGPVSAANSLVGTTAQDFVGSADVTPLSNGNYVVGSDLWHNGGVAEAGAATWGNGNGGTVGAISPANSLVGSTVGDHVGNVVTALGNGNFVVGSRDWHNGVTAHAGAATWADGGGGTVGVLSASNSLVGTTDSDQVGFAITALSNGNYVVQSIFSNNATAGVGAATWGNGAGGTTGPVSASNSLVGTTYADLVGTSVVALSNGNYVVGSTNWDNGGAADAGAVTWANGNGGTVGSVSASNSLVGTTAGDHVGYVKALSNGNYIVGSPSWNNAVGATTWGNGNGGTTGPVSASNSLVGSTSGDIVGAYTTALSNGNYVQAAPYWSGGASSVGAASWGNGKGGTVGLVSAGNSLVGTTTNDHVGNEGVTALSNGSYVVRSTDWNNGATTYAGAITLRRGSDRSSATITAENSVRGGSMGNGYLMRFDYDAARDQLVVGRPAENIVTLFKADLLLRDGFD